MMKERQGMRNSWEIICSSQLIRNEMFYGIRFYSEKEHGEQFDVKVQDYTLWADAGSLDTHSVIK
jgi:hypothetical protein